MVINKILDIGKAILKGKGGEKDEAEAERAIQSLAWLQRAFSFVDKRIKDSKSILPHKVGLSAALYLMLTPKAENGAKKSRSAYSVTFFEENIHLTAARAYYISSSNVPGNLDRAEAALKELSTSIDESGEVRKVQPYYLMSYNSRPPPNVNNYGGCTLPC